MNDTGIKAVWSRRIKAYPEHRVAKGVQGLPRRPLVGGEKDFPVRICVVQGVVCQTGALVHVVDIGGGGVEHASILSPDDAVHGVAGVASVVE